MTFLNEIAQARFEENKIEEKIECVTFRKNKYHFIILNGLIKNFIHLYWFKID